MSEERDWKDEQHVRIRKMSRRKVAEKEMVLEWCGGIYSSLKYIGIKQTNKKVGDMWLENGMKTLLLFFKSALLI